MGASRTRATITDVARAAGVSLSTVSRVMNDNPSVDAALASRVRAAAAELGYTANPLARSLVLGRTQTIAVVVPDLANPTFQEILRGLSRAASVDGYHVLVADSNEQLDDERLLAVETRRRTDGLVLCAPRLADDDLDDLLAEVGPAVVVNRAATTAAPVVAADYGAGLTALVDHLVARGHRRIAYLAGTRRSASNSARLDALARSRAAHDGLEIVEIPAGVDFDAGAASLGAVRDARATAALAFNDLVALGLLSAAVEHGVAVPGELSIAGFDDIPFARFTSPPLTTARVAAADLGAAAWQRMRALLAGEQPAADLVSTPELIARASTGPAPGLTATASA